MKPINLPPLREYLILTLLLNDDEEIYTSCYRDGNNYIYNKDIKIIYEDLVKTMKIDPSKVNKPIVELEEYGFMVKGNNVFYRAGHEAGLNSMIIDVNIRSLDDRHMSQFQLMDVPLREIKYQYHSIFFIDDYRERSIEKFVENINKKLNLKLNEGQAFFQALDFETVELFINSEVKQEKLEESYVLAKLLMLENCLIRSENGFALLN